MNFLLPLFVLVFVFNKNASCASKGIELSNYDRFNPEIVIHQLPEIIRELIKNGDAAAGVPVLDPYEFERGQFDFEGEIFNAHAFIGYGNLSGLGDFQLQKLTILESEICIEIDVSIPLLKINSEYYELSGSLYDVVPIKGQGVVYIEVYNMTLWGKIYLKQSLDSKAVVFDKLENFEFSIDKIVSRTQFDNNIDDVISVMVEDLLAGYLTRFSKFIAATYSDSLLQYINKTLEQFETWNILTAILAYLNEH